MEESTTSTESGAGGTAPSDGSAADRADSHSLHATIGRRLRDARQAAGLRQADVARELGMTQTRIARLELGRRRLLYVEALAFADLYGVSVLSFDPRTTSAESSGSRRRIRAAADRS